MNLFSSELAGGWLVKGRAEPVHEHRLTAREPTTWHSAAAVKQKTAIFPGTRMPSRGTVPLSLTAKSQRKPAANPPLSGRWRLIASLREESLPDTAGAFSLCSVVLP